MTVRDPPSWQSDTPDDQSMSPSSCPTPTDPDVDLNYTVGVTESTPYACQFCDRAFPRLSYLKRHEQNHGDQMPFKCDFCHRLFKHKRSRDRHIKLHTGDKKYRCPHCDSAFSRSDHLKIHMKTHDTAKPFQCTVCNRGYNTAAALTSHMQSHKKDPVYNFRCMQCPASFQTSQHLQDHLATHSSGSSSPTTDRTLQCSYCAHVAASHEALVQHVDQAHVQQERPKCPVCAESFPSLTTMCRHMKHKHVETTVASEVDSGGHRESPSKPTLCCTFCTKDNFISAEMLRIHVQLMHGASAANGDRDSASPRHSPRPCPNAFQHQGKSLALPPPVSSCRLRQTPSPVTTAASTSPHLSCEYCTMKFASIQALQKHTLSVHSFTEVLNGGTCSSTDFATCPHCMMGFANAALLAEHVQLVHELVSRSGSASPRAAARDVHAAQPSRTHSAVKVPRTSAAANASPPSSSSSRVASPERTVPPPSSFGPASTDSKVNGDCHHHQFAHPGTLLCGQCNAAFPDFEAFRTHLKTHLDEVVQKHVCSECQGEFGSEEQLDGHVVGHYLATATEYGCQSCLKLFSKPDELQKHLMDIHAHHLYRCSLCNKVFDSKVSVQVHFAVKHSNECKLYKCTSCASVFRSEMEFQLHVKVTHLRKAQPFRCLFCNFSYNSELELQCHLTTHKKQFACGLCDEAFHVEFLLDRHVQSKHAASTNCSSTAAAAEVGPSLAPLQAVTESHVSSTSGGGGSGDVPGAKAAPMPTTIGCGKSEDVKGTSSSLAAAAAPNSSSSSSSSSKKKSRCDICDAEFFTEVALATHRRQAHNIRTLGGSQKPGSHQQILSLYCAYCNESCKSRTELENHMKVHTASCGKHKCNICDEVCPTATILAEHKLTHCKVVAGSMCVMCKVNLKSEDQYYSHLQQHNSQGLPLPCVVCRQTLMTEIEVQMHVKFHLKNAEPLFPCCLCLKQHEVMNLIHNGTTLNGGVQSYICKECFHCSAPAPALGTAAFRCHEIRCSECKVKFESSEELDKHRSAAHKKTYQCIKCQMSFDTESEIQLHVTSHMLHEGTCHECKLCHKVFDSPAKLQCHLIEHTFEGCSSYSCYMCSAVFTTACLLQQHMLEHGLNSRPYDCSHCHQRFFFRAELENHVFGHGPDGFHLVSVAAEGDADDRGGGSGHKVLSLMPPDICGKELQCSECLHSFSSVASLANHRKIHQKRKASDGLVKCPHCADLFATFADMKQHSKSAHGDSRNHGNHQCAEPPFQGSLPPGHRRGAHAPQPGAKFPCPECHKEFTLARNLSIHMQLHGDEKLFDCPVCKRRFARKDCKDHLRCHGGNRPAGGGLPCPHCNKTFSRRVHLKEHVRRHVLHVCDTCHEVAPSAKALRKHMADVHCREYDFVCRVCSDPFATARSHRRHLLRAHGVADETTPPPPTSVEDVGGADPQRSPSMSSDSGGGGGDPKELATSECGSCSAMDSEDSRDSEMPLDVATVAADAESAGCAMSCE